jgi:thymidylate synthase ThyX
MNEDETGFGNISGIAPNVSARDQLLAIKKAQNFYDRILDGYGDDSIGELGGAHLAIENISMIAAKVIEDARIGGSPLEKSTRYTYFDQKVHGEYLFHKEAVLMTSAFRSLYLNTCNLLFDTYSRLIPQLTSYMMEKNPKDPEVSKSAYTAAIRAKVLDCVRGLLPASTLTNVGFFGNGRFYESLLHKLHSENLAELRDIGRMAYDELFKVIPSFVRRADVNHKTHLSYSQFSEKMRHELHSLAEEAPHEAKTLESPYVKLISSDADAPAKVAAALLYQNSSSSFSDLFSYCRQLPEEELCRIFDAACQYRETRRHKSPRGLENAVYTFEFLSDFGSYRDLQRHRTLTQERQLLSCDHGYYTPPELIESGLDTEYRAAMDTAHTAYETISKELIEEAQYVVPMAYHIRWYCTMNLRSIQWVSELRSQPAGHPAYRSLAQQLAACVIRTHPMFERFLSFVDYEQHEVGRLEQEVRSEQKRQMTANT